MLPILFLVAAYAQNLTQTLKTDAKTTTATSTLSTKITSTPITSITATTATPVTTVTQNTVTQSSVLVTKTETQTPDVKETKLPEQDCSKGRCKPAGQTVECIWVEKTQMFQDFKGVYLPVDLRPFFSERFPKSYSKVSFPSQMSGVEDFIGVFSGRDFSVASIGYEEYNILWSGCSLPSQRWYISALFYDMHDFFLQRNEECARASVKPNLCAKTMMERALMVEKDIKNQTLCNINDSKKAENYMNMLKTYTDTANCIPGENIEGQNKQCGYYSQYGACMHQSECNLEQSLVEKCPKILLRSESSTQNWVLPVVVSIIGILFLMVGFVALIRLRRTSEKINDAPFRPSAPMPFAQVYQRPVSFNDYSRPVSLSNFQRLSAQPPILRESVTESVTSSKREKVLHY